MSEPINPQAVAKAVQDMERSERVKRGLPPDHVLDMSEYPFKFAVAELRLYDKVSQELLRLNPGSDLAVAYRLEAVLAQKDYAQANALMDRYRELAPTKKQSIMQFGRAPDSASAVALPAVNGAYPTCPSFFFCCDHIYLQFCIPLLRSLARHAPQAPVHIHLMSRETDKLAPALSLPLKITWTNEDPADLIAALQIKPREYYGAARFIRFAEALEVNDGPLWMSDVDGLVTADPRALLTQTADAAMRVRPGRLEPWNQFSACLVMGTAKSRPYFRRVADILKADVHRGWWGIDQFAMFSAAIGLQPNIALLGPDMAAVDDTPGLFWFTAGKVKDGLLTDETPYAKLFREYW